MGNNQNPQKTGIDKFFAVLKRLNPFALPVGRGDDAYGLAVLRGFLISSLIAIVLISFITAKKNFFHIAGLSLTVAFASLLTGGLLGFLFGIPRSKQVPKSTTDATTDDKYTDNTNLEDISDWLTKIIVGISLVQFNTIQKYFHTICTNLSHAFKPNLEFDVAYAYSGALMTFYLISGFLAVYLWARTYLMKTLSNKDKIEIQQKINSQDRKLKIQKLESIKREFQKTIQRITINEQLPEFQPLIALANPTEPKYCEDCQKGRWGGKTKDADYTVTATVTKSNPLDTQSNIVINVSPTTGGIKTMRKALFILHDSFLPDMIKAIDPKLGNNFVDMEFKAYEAFTLGVIVENTDNIVSVYEIDLNKLENLPDQFAYTEEVLTIDEINKQLLELQ